MLRSAHLLLLSLFVAVTGVAGCGSESGSAPSDGPATGSADDSVDLVAGDIVVFAAASLTDAYTELGQAFMSAHPEAEVRLNFASSSDLVTQIIEGAPADVFASADEANMAKLTGSGENAGPPQIFATNSLEIIVGPDNPKQITGLADLARPDVLYVTAAPEVPIGRYASQVLDLAAIEARPVSLEENVKGIVIKVTLGEADAGIVYATDVIAAGDRAEGVAIPADVNVEATYPVVVTKLSANPAGARAFVEFTLADEGQRILARYGFGPA